MYPSREVYAASPLALVAAEVRFSDSARLRQRETLDAISLAMESEFPIPETVPRSDIAMNGDQPKGSPPTGVFVLANRQRTESLSFRAESLTFETTAYQEFVRLESIVQWACDVLVDLEVRPELRRVGLRYIDEIRVPELIQDAKRWGDWLDPRLVDQLEVESTGYPVVTAQGLTVYDLGDSKRLAFRFAALNQSPVVEPEILQPRHQVGTGPFFVLDFDGFQEFGGNSGMPLDSSTVIGTLRSVHAPTGALFQSVLTDRARELFRGDAQQ